MSFADHTRREKEFLDELNRPVKVFTKSDDGFTSFGVFDIPFDGAYRRQFYLGNRREEGIRAGVNHAAAQAHFDEVLGVQVTHHKERVRERKPEYHPQFEFDWQGQKVDGTIGLRFHAATAVEINLYSERSIPQTLTNQLYRGFKRWSDNWD